MNEEIIRLRQQVEEQQDKILKLEALILKIAIELDIELNTEDNSNEND